MSYHGKDIDLDNPTRETAKEFKKNLKKKEVAKKMGKSKKKGHKNELGFYRNF